MVRYLKIPTAAIRDPGFGHTHAKGDHREVTTELLLPVHMLLPSCHIHSREVLLTDLAEEQPLFLQAIVKCRCLFLPKLLLQGQSHCSVTLCGREPRSRSCGETQKSLRISSSSDLCTSVISHGAQAPSMVWRNQTRHYSASYRAPFSETRY